MQAKSLLHLATAVLLLTGARAAQAQGPTIDPTFQRTTVYAPAIVRQLLQQPDGRRVVLSNSTRAGRIPAGQVLCLQANSNQPDSVFTSNVRGLHGWVSYLKLLPGGKVLLVGYDSLRLGAVRRQYLLRLNADGTPDAGFDAQLTNISAGAGQVLSQPDGKLVLTGYYGFADGSSAGPLLRLLADGRRDAAFQANAPSLSFPGPNALALQPDGKLLLTGRFGQQGVLRLLPTGAPDPTFAAPALAQPAEVGANIAVQPDGRILVLNSNPSVGGAFPVVRLLPTGAGDASFQSALRFYAGASMVSSTLNVQADGRVLVHASQPPVGGQYGPMLLRLNADGSPDPSFVPAVGNTSVNGLQLLPSGQLLLTVADTSPAASARGVVLLNADGTRDTSLVPALFVPGQVNDVVRLPDGRYVVGGNFLEINGVPTPYLARLSATGVPEPGFPAAPPDDVVHSVLPQPDGRLLLGGYFGHLGGTARAVIGRLLPTGAVDAGFAPPFVAAPTYRMFDERRRLALLPDGRILLTGATRLAGATANDNVLRLLDGRTGQPDLSIPDYQATDVLVQPNGLPVVAGFYPSANPYIGAVVFRLLATGQPDPSFTTMVGTRSLYGGGPYVENLAQDSTGQLFCTGYYTSDTSLPSPYAHLYKLTPDGMQTAMTSHDGFRFASSVAVQALGQVLVAADLTTPLAGFGLSRRLPDLRPDPSFAAANGPAGSQQVRRLLVQPDGAVMVAGSFVSVGGQPIGGLTRLLAPAVLRTGMAAATPATLAWPVPARGQLHLSLDAAARPSRVELLDALGRPVLRQPATAELTLDISALPAGTYVLRVHYASGPVARRVLVE
ncbi:T9SS type A sorting domain-containing protein [Hymenobacter sp. ASUV-10]|uniref:T9SS type A sorting domain-containing protein n=1 Tax=Hymenobacter aranciens TaxID=3063996 RepID=A0ABT9BAC0_9BACT|nr:T9SS type A sorting domain-containing protein [Hymenobacter sp. ASUV-10]MDO7875178.1 T9SS type A sorting domain-containing protein [Hymenobacter sp. ASUV-10]